MERCFKIVNEIREKKRIRATFGIAEIQRTLSEIWEKLIPKRYVRGTHKNKKEDFRRNIFIGKCMNLGESWVKLYPELVTVFKQKPFLRKYLYHSQEHQMDAFFFNKSWKKLVICRCDNCAAWAQRVEDWKRI